MCVGCLKFPTEPMLNERDILTRSTAKWRTSHKSGRVREEMVRPQERTRRRIFRVWGFVAWANAPPRHSSPRRVPVLPTRTHDGVCLRWYGVGGEPLGSSGERCARAPAGECMTPRRTRPSGPAFTVSHLCFPGDVDGLPPARAGKRPARVEGPTRGARRDNAEVSTA